MAACAPPCVLPSLWHRFRNSIPAAFIATSVLLGLAPSEARAQIHPPKEGVSMPQAYYDRIKVDRTAFQFKHAWISEARHRVH